MHDARCKSQKRVHTETPRIRLSSGNRNQHRPTVAPPQYRFLCSKQISTRRSGCLLAKYAEIRQARTYCGIEIRAGSQIPWHRLSLVFHVFHTTGRSFSYSSFEKASLTPEHHTYHTFFSDTRPQLLLYTYHDRASLTPSTTNLALGVGSFLRRKTDSIEMS